VEVWNEPNTIAWWGQNPNPARYALTYWYAWAGNYDAEVAWGGNNPVMTGGGGKPNASCPGDGHYICVENFLTDTIANLNTWGFFALGGTIDMTGAHIYPNPGENLTRADASNQVGAQFNQVRRPYPWVPTFITEFGIRGDLASSQPPLQEGDSTTATELAQCNQLLDVYNGWLPSTATSGLLVFRLRDKVVNNPQVDFRRMGTLNQDGSAKLAYNVLRDQHRGWANRTSC
jgi:hypothetical protein